MSSNSDKPAPFSERPGENVSPAVAAARLIRSQAFLTREPDSSDALNTFVDKLNIEEVEGGTAEMLPYDMAEDDRAASEGAPPSQSPSTQLKDGESRDEADIAQGYYGVDVTSAGPDSSAIEDELIEEIDSQRGDAEDTAALHTKTVGSSDRTKYRTEDLVPGGAVVRRRNEGETVA